MTLPRNFQGPDSVTLDAAAENTFSSALAVAAGELVSVSVQPGTATVVTLQRRLDGATWRDVQGFSAATETTYQVDERGDLRLGVKTGDYGSGSSTGRLGVG